MRTDLVLSEYFFGLLSKVTEGNWKNFSLFNHQKLILFKEAWKWQRLSLKFLNSYFLILSKN